MRRLVLLGSDGLKPAESGEVLPTDERGSRELKPRLISVMRRGQCGLPRRVSEFVDS